jgi:hypothetical protein
MFIVKQSKNKPTIWENEKRLQLGLDGVFENCFKFRLVGALRL